MDPAHRTHGDAPISLTIFRKSESSIGCSLCRASKRPLSHESSPLFVSSSSAINGQEAATGSCVRSVVRSRSLPDSVQIWSLLLRISSVIRSNMTTDPERTVNTSATESVEDEDDSNQRKILRSTDVLDALRDCITTSALEQMQSLPAPVKRRIKALKQLQLVTTNIEAKFYEEVHALECEYYKMCAPLYQKRSEIVSGTYEPTDEQCVWESDDDEETLNNFMKEKAKIEDSTENKDETENEDDTKGIPDFWLTIFKNVGTLADMVQEHDEPILKHLSDIKVKFLESNPMGFVLEFQFTSNEYFSNSVLTKEYIMKCTPEKNDPFSFEGPEIYKCKGCVIDWKKGKNVTIKTIKKNQKHKSRGSMRTVTKTVQNDSFFNFFSPPIVPEDSEADIDDETQAILTSDFELGHYIRERIVPRAVLYYTGEGLEDEDEDYEDEEDGDDDDDVDEEDEEEEGSSPTNAPSGGKQGDEPNECKQQ